jgi:hypothetical protein
VDDRELLTRLAHALDTAPASPAPDRIAALRTEAEWHRRVSAGTAPRRHRPRLTPWLAAAAAVAALTAGVTITQHLGSDETVAGTVEYNGPMVGAGGEPVAELRVVAAGIGRVIELDTDALPILPRGEYYELWFVAPDDTAGAPHRISAGTFHPDPAGRSDVRFVAAVDPTLFPVVEVTAEPGARDPAPNGRVVLRTTLR